jgi:hypothetical protein
MVAPSYYEAVLMLLSTDDGVQNAIRVLRSAKVLIVIQVRSFGIYTPASPTSPSISPTTTPASAPTPTLTHTPSPSPSPTPSPFPTPIVFLLS